MMNRRTILRAAAAAQMETETEEIEVVQHLLTEVYYLTASDMMELNSTTIKCISMKEENNTNNNIIML